MIPGSVSDGFQDTVLLPRSSSEFNSHEPNKAPPPFGKLKRVIAGSVPDGIEDPVLLPLSGLGNTSSYGLP